MFKFVILAVLLAFAAAEPLAPLVTSYSGVPATYGYGYGYSGLAAPTHLGYAAPAYTGYSAYAPLPYVARSIHY